MIHRIAGEREALYLTPLYHFYLLDRHLDISQAIAAKSSPLQIASRDSDREVLVFERKSLTTKLHALIWN